MYGGLISYTVGLIRSCRVTTDDPGNTAPAHKQVTVSVLFERNSEWLPRVNQENPRRKLAQVRAVVAVDQHLVESRRSIPVGYIVGIPSST